MVTGDLTFSTIGKDAVKSMDFLTTAKEVTLDLSQVGLTDSAGLALIIEWIKHARGKRIHAVFKNIPEQLHNLAKLSGFDKIDSSAINSAGENQT